MNGQLFTQDFLKEGIKSTPVLEKLPDAELDRFIAQLRSIYAPFRDDSKLNEATTEQEILLKVLAALGWGSFLCHRTERPGRGARTSRITRS